MKKFKKGHILSEEECKEINNAFALINELIVKFDLTPALDKTDKE